MLTPDPRFDASNHSTPDLQTRCIESSSIPGLQAAVLRAKVSIGHPIRSHRAPQPATARHSPPQGGKLSDPQSPSRSQNTPKSSIPGLQAAVLRAKVSIGHPNRFHRPPQPATARHRPSQGGKLSDPQSPSRSQNTPKSLKINDFKAHRAGPQESKHRAIEPSSFGARRQRRQPVNN